MTLLSGYESDRTNQVYRIRQHSPRQRRFCPFRNEWHLIKEMDIDPPPRPRQEFGPPNDDDEPMVEYGRPFFQPEVPPLAEVAQSDVDDGPIGPMDVPVRRPIPRRSKQPTHDDRPSDLAVVSREAQSPLK